MILTSFLLLASIAGLVSAHDETLCVSPNGTYTMKLNLFAGELGYFTFDECPDHISPTIGFEIGKTYTINQADRSNYYHPVGLAYYADGAHADLDELEPGIAPYGTNSTCSEDMSCPAPMYFADGKYLGTYSNNPDIANVTTGEDNFGLDDYEPRFFHPLPEWTGYGAFEVKILFDNQDFVGDLFYFCHIHEFMSGRIKLLKNGVPIQDTHAPELPYEYDVPGSFDKECGTFGLDSFQLPHEECLDKFVCDVPSDNVELAQFSKCIDAMDCHMMAGMTTGVSATGNNSLTALFIHQMVPHHQNAVNMAKVLLNTGKVICDDLTSDDDPMCAMEVILREIVADQNAQIQAMYGVLEELGSPKTNDCKVMVAPSPASAVKGGNSGAVSLDATLVLFSSFLSAFLILVNR